MAEWMKLATAFAVVGFQLILFGLGQGDSMTSTDGSVQALFVIGFLCYVALFMVSLGSHFGEMKHSKWTHISLIALAFTASALILIAYIVYAATVNASPHVYVSTFVICAAALAIGTGVCEVVIILQTTGEM